MDAREARLFRSVLVPTVALGAVVALTAGVAGCVPGEAAAAAPSASAVPAPCAQVRDLKAPTLTLPSDDPAELALTASQLVFEQAPVLVLAATSDDVAAAALSPVAEALHAPALLADGPDDRAIRTEAERLGAAVAVVVEQDRPAVSGPGSSDAEAAARAAGLAVVRVDAGDVVADRPEAAADPGGAEGAGRVSARPGAASPATGPDERLLEDLRAELGARFPAAPSALLSEVLVLVHPVPGQEAALATLRAAGAVTVPDLAGDPGADGATVRLVADAHALTVVGVGTPYADAATFAWQVAAAETGVILPTGSQRLGDAPRWDAIRARAGRELPDPADAEAGTVPAVVLRAAARQTSAGTAGDYLRAEPLDTIAVTVAEAKAAGQYVVLELEGGRVALADQVHALEPVLAQGGTGVMVHPEQRRSGAGQQRGGQVTVEELQEVVDQLSGLAATEALPQVLLAVTSLDTAVEDGGAGLVTRPQVAVVDAGSLGLGR